MNFKRMNTIIQEARVALLNNKCNAVLINLNLLQIELDLEANLREQADSRAYEGRV